MKVQELPIPDKLDVIYGASDITIRRKWFALLEALPLPLFVLFWDGFLIFWYTVALSKDSTPLMAILFPIGHITIGLCLTYYLLCIYLNKTDLAITPSEVTIRTHPLRWFGDKRILTQDISGVCVRKRENQEPVSYTVNYISADNHEKKLMGGIKREEQAEYYRLQLEDLLRLTPISSPESAR